MTAPANPAPEDLRPDVLELDPAAGNLPVAGPAVVAVGWLARWRDTEPVRLYLYPVVVSFLALLVGYGLVSDDVAPLWEALAGAVFSVGSLTAVAKARAAVHSPRSVREAA
jgi:hypothetical protein